MQKSRRRSLPGRLLLVVGAVCVFGVGATSLSAGGPLYTDWSTPVNLGSVVNAPSFDTGATLSKDGKTLYFGSNRPGGMGGFDLYVSHRQTVNDLWGAPVNLGPTVNTPSLEAVPVFSPDGHRMFF